MNNIISKLKKEFKKKILDVKVHNKVRCYITIDKNSLLDVADFLYNKLKCRFSIATGLDNHEGLEIIYHFSDDNKTGAIINIKVMLSYKTPVVESLTQVFPGAEWIEREIHELLGVNFKNHPNLVPFLLPDDWPKGKYPLRKDFKL